MRGKLLTGGEKGKTRGNSVNRINMRRLRVKGYERERERGKGQTRRESL